MTDPISPLPGAVCVAVPAEADLPAIARAAGGEGETLYSGGHLYVAGVTQEALDEAAAQIGAGPAVRPRIHAAFADRVASGLPVAGQDGVVALDPDSRRELTAAAVMASLGAWPAGGFWRLSDNTNIALTGLQVMALGKAAAARYQTLFGVRSLLLDAVAAGQAVDPAAGWPTAEAFDPAG